MSLFLFVFCFVCVRACVRVCVCVYVCYFLFVSVSFWFVFVAFLMHAIN